MQERFTVHQQTGVEEYQVAYAEVSTCLNIREGAGMEYDVIAQLPKNGYCEVKKEQGEWCYIASENIEGYVYKDIWKWA